jgi:hypothetical protein
MNRYLVLLMGILCASTVLAGGCSSARKSKKGESCEHSLECESGDLACKGGTCALADFSLKPTGKQCSVYECTTPTECCLDINDTACQTWKAGCSVNDPPSDTNCRSYEAFCRCNVSRVQCANGQCTLGCTENDQCGNGLECTDGRCVECTNDAACAGRGTPQNPYVCENNACVAGCTNNADCSGGRNCFVGHCADEVTCTTNRECIAYTKNVEAFCRDSKCIKPCGTDLDCDSPTAFKYNACVDKECKTVGCESARECELYSGIVSGDKTGLGRTVTVQCQTAPAD